MLLTLPIGTTVLVRPIEPEDKPLLSLGLKTLSPETAMRRFLTLKTSFSAAELRYLTEVDQVDHIALVAVDADHGFLIGVARCVRVAPDTAELAIVIGDPWQRQGLGRALVDELAVRASAQGITRFSGTMMATNRGAVRLMRGFGTHIDRDLIESGVREIVVQFASSAQLVAPMH
ncbi:GNAT family N-acetyltransferase [Solirubrobacter phytolaccae]|uniref:GNAT family N-acetyltransferase n=1 Tax=Solirubrobacter phytolaccae TaxID=1404360 RepID=A0A9X3S7B9_9ACTN|nr:GNAT family N-acetyltransferase [Solirubrobacter phytolaccae]MDA0178971.1 GNAT family N-acetyltransferase [Solirubrobacter phytolaccae]